MGLVRTRSFLNLPIASVAALLAWAAMVPAAANAEDTGPIKMATDAKCPATPATHDIQLNLRDVISSVGNLRVSLYSGDKDRWLKKRSYILRYDVPAQEGDMTICIPLPNGPDNYAMSVYHDENADRDFQRSVEGGGFSRDAKPGFLGIPPSFKKVVFAAESGRTLLTINLRYPKKRTR